MQVYMEWSSTPVTWLINDASDGSNAFVFIRYEKRGLFIECRIQADLSTLPDLSIALTGQAS